ncbi:hypothetical protein EX30DRAFT_365541 [Ascodesmis nigricans]|uniref:Uncharacterized protein n=1 Tax=Ascodesmis nigricans TaxID=341454 RepID=A0A4S2MRX4_9PEZI|nr:hypothetical protein EX30DRAFT_365541 [Ascodesmis nigricans]
MGTDVKKKKERVGFSYTGTRPLLAHHQRFSPLLSPSPLPLAPASPLTTANPSKPSTAATSANTASPAHPLRIQSRAHKAAHDVSTRWRNVSSELSSVTRNGASRPNRPSRPSRPSRMSPALLLLLLATHLRTHAHQASTSTTRSTASAYRFGCNATGRAGHAGSGGIGSGARRALGLLAPEETMERMACGYPLSWGGKCVVGQSGGEWKCWGGEWVPVVGSHQVEWHHQQQCNPPHQRTLQHNSTGRWFMRRATQPLPHPELSPPTTMPRDARGRRYKTTEDERVRIIQAHARDLSYRKIQEELGFGKSTAQRIIKEWKAKGSIHCGQRPGPPPRLSVRSIKYLEGLLNKYPRASLAEITYNSRLNIKPRIAGKYLRAEHLSGAVNGESGTSIWQKKIYTDEVRVQVGGGTNARRKVQRPVGSEAALDPRFLRPTLIGEVFRVRFWGAFTYGEHTPLVMMQERTEEERTNEKDRLGFNLPQYMDEILKLYLKPLFDAFRGLDKDVETVEDGASYHKSAYTTRARLQVGVKGMAWPALSPELNCMGPFQNALRTRSMKT